MKAKTAILLLALIAPGLSLAKGGTITFKGRVVAQMTYQATVNGQSHGVVQLPTVKTANLDDAATAFSVGLKRQAQETGTVSAGFVSRHTTAQGNLKNVAKGQEAAQAVQVQLVDSSSQAVRFDKTRAFAAQQPDDSAQSFAVRYVAEHSVAKSGAVTVIAEYAVAYL